MKEDLIALGSVGPQLRGDALTELWEYAVGSPSKQTRSRLLRAAEKVARSGCGEPDSRVELAAAAVEMFHLASLPHDDIMDGSEFRRGIASLPAQFGAPLAATAGGLFFGRSSALFARCGRDAVTIAAETTERMCEGQMLELRDRYDTGRSPRRYFDAIKNKTAGMFWLAAELGAVLGDAEPATHGRIGEYGLCLGVAFQMIDDLLDIAGDERLMGKPCGADLRNGNYTLAVIYALEEAPELRELLVSDADVQIIVRRILATNAITRTRSDARAWIWKAKTAVRQLPLADELLAMADAELERLVFLKH